MEEQRVPGDDRDKRKCDDFASLYSMDTGHGHITSQRSLSDHGKSIINISFFFNYIYVITWLEQEEQSDLVLRKIQSTCNIKIVFFRNGLLQY